MFQRRQQCQHATQDTRRCPETCADNLAPRVCSAADSDSSELDIAIITYLGNFNSKITTSYSSCKIAECRCNDLIRRVPSCVSIHWNFLLQTYKLQTECEGSIKIFDPSPSRNPIAIWERVLVIVF